MWRVGTECVLVAACPHTGKFCCLDQNPVQELFPWPSFQNLSVHTASDAYTYYCSAKLIEATWAAHVIHHASKRQRGTQVRWEDMKEMNALLLPEGGHLLVFFPHPRHEVSCGGICAFRYASYRLVPTVTRISEAARRCAAAVARMYRP